MASIVVGELIYEQGCVTEQLYCVSGMIGLILVSAGELMYILGMVLVSMLADFVLLPTILMGEHISVILDSWSGDKRNDTLLLQVF